MIDAAHTTATAEVVALELSAARQHLAIALDHITNAAESGGLTPTQMVNAGAGIQRATEAIQVQVIES